MTPPETITQQPTKVRTRRAPRKVTAAKPATAASRRAAATRKIAATRAVSGATRPATDEMDTAAAHQETALATRPTQFTELSDAWFRAVRERQESAIGRARRFVDVVDKVLPVRGGEDSRRRTLIDGAFELADWAAETQLGLARSAMQSAMLVYVDVNVNVDTDVDAFANNDTKVDVSVPTDVGAFKAKTGGAR
ncbi:MAG: hypothetical protein HY827_07345 [Actinobacteria bacterium]|nr:hypothetical protein [Actinomycetota bacterium]